VSDEPVAPRFITPDDVRALTFALPPTRPGLARAG
jgi:hypothetical protein